MKKYLMVILLMALGLSGKSQKKDTSRVFVPVKDGSITYESINDHPNLSKDKIYELSLKWLANTFLDSKEVIRVQNRETGNILGNGITDIIISGFFGSTERFSFMIDITVKDSKSRLRLYQFMNKSLDSKYDFRSTDPVWVRFDNGKSFTPKDDKKMFSGLNARINGLIENYKKYINSNTQIDEF
ncbi:DUF4468 domain-containing protein [Pedobacter metabolipauper]|uniref:Uncharacterized protein with TBP-like fold DUF4468 n=1 Tax=Pedobacter metabolipauper TaxID=425513 RepID=A0A4R6T0G5_9SPHI|nr:DUF4468 domain-containing protein [Pedobacter metabolipauper]TDQ12798.1 uncharacterized protein with TBP-like fold DUF4468 [Pedobacter metabolipauper]